MKTTELYDHLEHLQAELDSVTRFEKERSLIAVAEECERRADRVLRGIRAGYEFKRRVATELRELATDLRRLADAGS